MSSTDRHADARSHFGHKAMALEKYINDQRRRREWVPQSLVREYQDARAAALALTAARPPVAPHPAPPPVERQVLTRMEAARALGVSLSTIKRRIADGQLPEVRIGTASRIRIGDVEAYRSADVTGSHGVSQGHSGSIAPRFAEPVDGASIEATTRSTG